MTHAPTLSARSTSAALTVRPQVCSCLLFKQSSLRVFAIHQRQKPPDSIADLNTSAAQISPYAEVAGILGSGSNPPAAHVFSSAHISLPTKDPASPPHIAALSLVGAMFSSDLTRIQLRRGGLPVLLLLPWQGARSMCLPPHLILFSDLPLAVVVPISHPQKPANPLAIFARAQPSTTLTRPYMHRHYVHDRRMLPR